MDNDKDKDIASPVEILERDEVIPFEPVCNRHPTPKPMKFSTTTDKHNNVERFLTCTRCWRTIRVGPDVERMVKTGMTKEDREVYQL